MRREEVTAYIKTMLTGGVLELEVEDGVLYELVNEAYEKVLPFISDTREETVMAASVIDVSEFLFSDVVSVVPAVDNHVGFGDEYLDRSVRSSSGRSLVNVILQNHSLGDEGIDFKYQDKKVYLDVSDISCGAVTIEGVVEPAFEDIRDSRAKDWIKQYSLALSKEVVGRVRSKFKPQGVPVELDGDTLLAEGKEEKEKREQELRDNPFGLFIVSR